ncbi:MAG: hypothetical protein ACOC6K_01110 [Thermodesulfobacteriota bacterium]
MPANRSFVAFPLVLPWRQEFWSLPLYFPDLKVGVLWQWPAGLPYQGRALPPDAAAGGQDLGRYAPGELKQWQAFEEYASDREKVSDIVRALRGQAAEPQVPEGPWKDRDPLRVAWQLEVMEADQEAHLAQVDRGDEWLGQILTPETIAESGSLPVAPEDIEVLDPETARLRYLLWRRELGDFLRPQSVPLLLGRTSRSIFLSLRREAGGGGATKARVRLPGCRTEEEYQAAQNAAAQIGWLKEFQRKLGACLLAAQPGGELEARAWELNNWLSQELPRLWPEAPAWTWELEIWAQEPEIREAGEALLAWGGLGKTVVPG